MMLIKGTKGRDRFKIFLRSSRDGKTLLDLSQAVKNVFVFVLSFIIGVVRANKPNLLEKFGGHFELMDDWARHLSKSMEWVKRKGITGKVESSENLLQEEKFLISVKFQELY